MADGDPLSSFEDTEKLVIKQKVELLEVAAQTLANALDMDALGALGETANKYDVYTDSGGLKYKVIETSEWFGCDGCCITGRACCAPNHKLQLHVYDSEYSASKEIMYMDRPCKCGQCCACCSICKQEMTVYQGDDDDPKAQQIAFITQPFLGGVFTPTLQVMEREDDDEPYATIEGSACCMVGGVCCDHTFNVKDADGNEIGKITKEGPEGLSGLMQELGTDADNFTMKFPKEYNNKQKASMLAAMHLLDYMFFEDEGAANVDMTPLMEGGCPEITFKCCDLYCFGCLCPCTCTIGGKSEEEGGEEEAPPEDGAEAEAEAEAEEEPEPEPEPEEEEEEPEPEPEPEEEPEEE